MTADLPQAPERDPRIMSAIANWAPRFLSHGIANGDFDEVTRDLVSWDEWCAAWSARGAHHAQLGERAEAEGRTVSAGEHYRTAALCYHYGKFLFVQDQEQMRAAHERVIELTTRALPYLDPPGERCAIPYGDGTLYGILRRPDGVARPPVVVLVSGLDSTKEEMGPHEDALLARGLATFAFDGPGQGEAEYDHPLRHDVEVAVAAAIDLLETRDDIDAARCGIWGRSLGGHLVIRASAFEPRIRACVSLSGTYDLTATWGKRPPLNQQAYIVRTHSADADAALAYLGDFTLAGVAERVTCPTYVVGGTKDRLTSHTNAERIAAEVSGPVVLNIVEGGSHTASNKPYAYRPEAADWMASILRG